MASGGPYSEKFTSYMGGFDPTPGKCYEFTITDSYGDG